MCRHSATEEGGSDPHTCQSQHGDYGGVDMIQPSSSSRLVPSVARFTFPHDLVAIPSHDHLCSVCSTPHLPASSVFHLVWELGRLAWEHHHLETLGRLPHLPHHALPLHRLLAGPQVPGTKNKMSGTLVGVLEASTPPGVYRWTGGHGQVLPNCQNVEGE